MGHNTLSYLKRDYTNRLGGYIFLWIRINDTFLLFLSFDVNEIYEKYKIVFINRWVVVGGEVLSGFFKPEIN